MVTGTQMHYVAGEGHRPLPMATDLLYRKAHAPRAPKPVGLDWDAITPRCKVCGEKSTQLNNEDTCPPCAGTVAPATAVRPAPKPARRPAKPRTPNVARAPRAPRAPREPRPARQPREQFGSVDTAAIRRLYSEDQLTIAKVSEATGHAKGTVRAVLIDAGITLRDDRKTHSGGRNRKVYPPEFVEQIRRLYVDEVMTQAEIAQRLGTSQKVISLVMARHEIPARPASPRPAGQQRRPNPMENLKTQIAELGVTSREIKEWAVREGLLLGMQVGVPPARLVDAYAAAHLATAEDASS